MVAAWLSSNGVVHINKVTLHRTRLVLGWVTVCRFNSLCRTFISVCNQPPRPTQPGHPFVGRHSEYQPNDGDALRLEVKAGMVCVWVKLCDPIVTHGPYLSTKGLIIKHYINSSVYFTLLTAF